MRCPKCGLSNRTGALYCEDCGYLMFDQDAIPTKQLDTSKRRQRRATDSVSTIALIIRDCEDPITMDLTKRTMIGRVDPVSDEMPDLDLSQFDASDLGVSRVHAAFDSLQNPPVLIDMGSANGTFVNGQKLTPHHPWRLHDGDEIRLGRLVTRVLIR